MEIIIVIVLDTNVLIEILKGNKETITKVQSFDETLLISSITAMEIYYGAKNKAELKKLEQFTALFKVEHLTKDISIKATGLIITYAKSHTLDIPDSLIAATALVSDGKIFTYNKKDFRYIDKLTLV